VAEAVPWLRDHLREDPLLRLSCARALADLDDLEALPAIISSLSEYHSSLVEVTDIVCAFGRPAVPVLRESSRSGRPEERRLAARALGQLRALEAVPELRAAMDSSDDELAAAATRALGRINDVSTVPDLERVFASERAWFVRVAAAHALGNIYAETTPAVLVGGLSSHAWFLRHAAAGSLRAMGEMGLDAVTVALDAIPDRGVAHFAGLLDVTDEFDSVIDRAASGDEQLERFVQRACGVGAHARLDELADGDGPRAEFCTRVLATHRPADAVA
jgi:HEAT repeat protein